MHLGLAWKIEFSYRNIHEYWGRSKGRARGGWNQLSELTLLTAPNIREYFGNYILHACLGLRRAVNQLIHRVDHTGNHARTHARSSSTAAAAPLSDSEVMPARITDARCSLNLEFPIIQGIPVLGYFFSVQCTYGCCIAICTVVNFPCQYGDIL